MERMKTVTELYDTVRSMAEREGLAVTERAYSAKVLYIRTKDRVILNAAYLKGEKA